MDNTYKNILDNLYDGVYFVDQERKITYWNKGAERITGYLSEYVVNSFCYDNILNHVTEHGVNLCLNGCPLQATIQDGKPREAEVFLHHRDGHRVPILVRTSPLHSENGEIIGAVEIFSNNTSLMSVRRQVHKLEQTVLLDTLTGIGNRRHMEIKLQSALGEFQQHRIPFGLAFADIDYFKRINDMYGHENGDRVLRMVATTLRQNLRADDTSARWGGEEFLILFYDIDQKGLEAASEKLRLLIEKSRMRFGMEQVSITISIGATMARFEDDIVSILRRADTLMYKSKINGRNRVTTG